MKRLLMISIDGLGWRLSSPKANVPTLRRLARRGICGPLTSVLPSSTWPAHVTLTTGCYPARHGVVANKFYSRKSRRAIEAWQVPRAELIAVPTLFDLAQRQKIHAAAVFWPGTQNDPSLRWQIPLVYGRRELARASSPGLLKALISSGVPAQWFDSFTRRAIFLRDAAALATAQYLVKAHAPVVLSVHFDSVDSYSHVHGANSRPTFWALEAIDRHIAKLLGSYRDRGLLAETVVAIVSDHGMFPVTQRLDGDTVLFQAGALASRQRPDDGPVICISQGQLLYLYSLDRNQLEPLTKAARAFQARPEVEQLIWHKAFGAHHLPQPGAGSRSPDLIVVAKPHVAFGPNSNGQPLAPVNYGTHGYLPNHAEMLASYLICGPGVAPQTGALPLQAVDIAPTLAKLIGLPAFPRADGRANRLIVAK